MLICCIKYRKVGSMVEFDFRLSLQHSYVKKHFLVYLSLSIDDWDYRINARSGFALCQFLS